MGLHKKKKKTLSNIININILTRHKIYVVKRAFWTSGAKGAGVQAPIAPPPLYVPGKTISLWT